MEVASFFQNIKTLAIVVHVVGVVFGMGGALISDVFFYFFSKDRKLNNTEIYTLSTLHKLIFYSLIFIILSGLAIFLSNTEKYLHSVKFLAKMSILCVLLINGYFLNEYIWPHVLNKNFFASRKERKIRKLAFVGGAISVVSWISVCVLGVLDSISIRYEVAISLYLFVVLFAVTIALWVEKKQLD